MYHAVIPFNFYRGAEPRLTWQNVLYSAYPALVVINKPKALSDIENMVTNIPLAIKFIPFKSEFRAKMLSQLLDNTSSITEHTSILGVTIRYNILTREIKEFEDIRTQEVQFNQTSFTGSNPEGKSITNEFLETHGKEFKPLLEKFCQTALFEHLASPFVSFYPDLTLTWNEAELRNFPKADSFIPYSSLVPKSFSIEASKDGSNYILDDLYCINYTAAGANNADSGLITCLVIQESPESGQEIPVSGFKYNPENEALYPLSNFTTDNNYYEWFSIFQAKHPLDLHLVLKSRFEFLKQKFNTL